MHVLFPFGGPSLPCGPAVVHRFVLHGVCTGGEFLVPGTNFSREPQRRKDPALCLISVPLCPFSLAISEETDRRARPLAPEWSLLFWSSDLGPRVQGRRGRAPTGVPRGVRQGHRAVLHLPLLVQQREHPVLGVSVLSSPSGMCLYFEVEGRVGWRCGVPVCCSRWRSPDCWAVR